MKTILSFKFRLDGYTPPALPCHGSIAASAAIIGVSGEATIDQVPSDHETATVS